MNANFANKLARVEKLRSGIDALAHDEGVIMPCSYPGAPNRAIQIDMPPLLIRISPDRFRCNAAKSKTMIGESVLERRGWTLYDLSLHGSKRLAFNVSDEGAIDIFLFQPGRWMRDFFGVDTGGDETPILSQLFEDEKNPAWRAFKKTGLYKWPPEFSERAA